MPSSNLRFEGRGSGEEESGSKAGSSEGRSRRELGWGGDVAVDGGAWSLLGDESISEGLPLKIAESVQLLRAKSRGSRVEGRGCICS